MKCLQWTRDCKLIVHGGLCLDRADISFFKSGICQHVKIRSVQTKIWSLFSGKVRMQAHFYMTVVSWNQVAVATLDGVCLTCPLHLFSTIPQAPGHISVCNPGNRAVAFCDALSKVSSNNCSCLLDIVSG